MDVRCPNTHTPASLCDVVNEFKQLAGPKHMPIFLIMAFLLNNRLNENKGTVHTLKKEPCSSVLLPTSGMQLNRAEWRFGISNIDLYLSD